MNRAVYQTIHKKGRVLLPLFLCFILLSPQNAFAESDNAQQEMAAEIEELSPEDQEKLEDYMKSENIADIISKLKRDDALNPNLSDNMEVQAEEQTNPLLQVSDQVKATSQDSMQGLYSHFLSSTASLGITLAVLVPLYKYFEKKNRGKKRKFNASESMKGKEESSL